VEDGPLVAWLSQLKLYAVHRSDEVPVDEDLTLRTHVDGLKPLLG
jgi:hypothetical protein